MIGVFDSGLGGLTILKEIKRVLPEYDYLYFGDTLHVPYGNRSDEAVFNLTKSACEYLFGQGCGLIILACNTASAKALRKLQQEYLPDKRTGTENILGVVRPMAEAAIKLSKGKIGVIGTRGTVKSGSYVLELDQQDERDLSARERRGYKQDKMEVFQRECPLLVPMIEEGWLKRKETKSILRYYLRPLKLAGVDLLILGCTHYPLLIKQIRNILGKRCAVPNPGEIVASSLKDYLERHPEIERFLTKSARTRYVVTDLNENFEQMASRFLGSKIEIERLE